MRVRAPVCARLQDCAVRVLYPVARLRQPGGALRGAAGWQLMKRLSTQKHIAFSVPVATIGICTVMYDHDAMR